MEAIIHPGMHKTGTSSIQATLMALKPSGLVYPYVPTGNMTAIMVSMFHDNPEEFHGFKANGLTAERIAEIRSKNYEIMERCLSDGIEKSCNAIFTSEYISAASKDSVVRLQSFFRERGYSPKIIAYVRKPLSFMESAFQQMLKANLKHFNDKTLLWPDYRGRFEKLDEIFGSENVQLTIFDSKKLQGGDVCIDFFQKIGINLEPTQVIRMNEGLSLTASAFLFSQRNLGEGFVQGFKGAAQKNNAFISTLSRMPGEPLRFKRSFVAPLFEKNRADLDWMEERLGVSLSDLPDEDAPSAIGSEEELLAIADQHQDELEELLLQEIRRQGQKPRDRLVRNLELLRKMHY